MQKFNFKFKSVFILFIAFILLSLIALFGDFSENNPPIKKSVDFSKNGIASDFYFNVEKHWVYKFSIGFGYPQGDENERSRVRRIVGGHELNKHGFPIDPGIPISLNLNIFKVIEDGNELIYQKSIDPILTSWGGRKDGKEFFIKNIGFCDLDKGVYRFVLEVKKGEEKYATIPSYVFIGSNEFKTTFDFSKSNRSETCPQ